MAKMADEYMVVQETNDALMNIDLNNLVEVAERADKMVDALKKIMNAAIRITTPKDWVLIGGTPYLQEAGASKVARLFGISWQICEGYPIAEKDAEGYPTYTYRMKFRMGSTEIEAEGMRSAADEFFVGRKTDKAGNPLQIKSADEIDLADVRRAAYTNCLNRGIKGILPGLRNLDVCDLEAAGLTANKIAGYDFKTGSKGGNSGKAEDSGLTCSRCGKAITQKVASYSKGKYGAALCMDCQKAGTAPEGVKEVYDDDHAFPDDLMAPPFEGGGR